METACPLLWNHFCVKVGSKVVPCCRVDVRGNIGNWSGDDIKNGIYSKDHILTRQNMRDNKRPKVCEVCYRQEDVGIESSRQKYLKRYNEVNYDLEPNTILTADIKFNNTCNLACRMCSPMSSSLISSLLKNIPQQDRIHNVPIKPQNYKEDEKLEYCKELIKNGLEEFKTTGGEPFYQKHFHKLLDWCIENNYNKKLAIKITTNSIDLRHNVLEKLLSFKKCDLNISVDGYKHVYEYIRYPGKWEVIDTNLKKIIDKQNNNFTVNISTLLNIYNLFDIPNIEEYLSNIGYKNKLNVECYIKPYDKSELNVKNLTKDIIVQAIESNSNYKVKTYLQSIKDDSKDKNLLYEFIRKTKLYDKHRNQSYSVLHPSIVNLIKEGINV